MRAVAPSWDDELRRRLEALERAELARSLRPIERAVDPVLLLDGQPLVNLSSNDYLGLAGHPLLAEAVARAAAQRGAGATASRLIVGTDRALLALERELAAFKGTEAALVFSSGYSANVGVLAALLEPGDAVFADRLDHASIWDGIRLSGARLYRYGHGDVEQLEALLARAARRRHRRSLIVSETVFSMDGDVAPLAELVELKERYGAALMLDDAHGGGVFGPHGEGYAHELGLAEAVDLQLGTFGKAFGCFGAYVAGRELWIRYLVNTCRSFVYTTALPPPVVESVVAALELVRGADEARARLRQNVEWFRTGVEALGFDTRVSTTQIVPAVIGTSEATLAASRALEARGVLAVAIRPPTVSRGTARLRFSLSAAHEQSALEQALGALGEVARQTDVIAYR